MTSITPRRGRPQRVTRLSSGRAATTVSRSLARAAAHETMREYGVLDDLVGSGLLAGDAGGLRFRHEIARLAVQEAIQAHRAGPLHARILDALRDDGCTDHAVLAFHAEAAGDAPAVVEYAHRAARRAADLASHREAAAQYQRALRAAGEAEPATVAELCDGLAYELSLIDRWTEAAEVGARALAVWRNAGDRLREGATLRRLSRTQWRLCRGGDAVTTAEAALAVLEPMDPNAELAWAYANLGSLRMVAGEHGAAIDLARRAQALAQRLGAAAVLSDALNTQACALASAGGDWEPRLRRALDIAISIRLPEQAGRAFANLYALCCGQGRYAEAERYFQDGIGYCDEHDVSTFGTCLRGERTGALERLGRWAESRELATEILASAGPSPINRITPLVSLGMICAREGDPLARECLEDAAATAAGTGEPSRIVAAALALTEARWLEGDLTEARRTIEAADDVSEGCDGWQRGAIAVWLQRTGSDRPPHGPLAGPYRLQIEGGWSGAAAAWTALGCRYEAAMCLLDNRREASVREALPTFQDLGAAVTVRVARRTMRQAGIRSIPSGAHPTTRAHPLGLTRREREVLHLICHGQTNAQIAARLFISAKTVDHHVSAVLAKLHVPRRSLAATEAARLGLLDSAEI